MADDGKVVLELQGVDRPTLAHIWQKMRQGIELKGQEAFIGRSMADHPDWFPIFETMDVLGGEDELPDGSNPFMHLTFHIIIGSQIFNQNPPEAQTFYRMRLRKKDHPHDIIHMMLNVFQRHLAWAAQNPGPDGRPQFDQQAYADTLKALWGLKSQKLWERLGFDGPPDRSGMGTPEY
ncbi:MAG: DUF1841 family protein [Bradymonadia bacterium]